MTMNRNNYKRLGDYVRLVDVRNRDLAVTNLLGVSISKMFIPSIANTIGTDMSTYKIVEPYQFAYGPVTSRNGDKITFALYKGAEKCIISSAYITFEVIDKEKLDPDYLMMWALRPEFDRYARFMSNGSAREIFSWDDMCEVYLPIPDINEQRCIVAEYQAVEKRIATNEALIAQLEETAQTIYKKMFVDDIDPENLPNGWSHRSLKEIVIVKGGKRLPKGEELTDIPNSHPYIKVADMSKARILELDDSFQYVEDDIQSSISRYNVSSGDVILSIVGTIGNVNIVGDSLDKANLTENCVKLVGKKEFSNLVYAFLTSTEGKKQIEQAIVGGVQSKLPIYNIEKLDLILPDTVSLNQFNSRISVINEAITLAIKENKELRKLSLLMHARLSS